MRSYTDELPFLVGTCMNNHMYDLVKALGETAKAREVYKTYAKDTKCDECIHLWNRLIGQQQDDIDEMKELLISHIEEAKFI